MAGLQRGIPLNRERKSPGRWSDAGVSFIQVMVMLQAALLLIALSAALIAWSLQAGQYGSFTAITTFYTEATPALLARLALYQIWVLWAVVILALLALRWRLAQQLLAILLLLFCMLPLLSLFGSQHYIAGLGGFPIIGSGQGYLISGGLDSGKSGLLSALISSLSANSVPLIIANDKDLGTCHPHAELLTHDDIERLLSGDTHRSFEDSIFRMGAKHVFVDDLNPRLYGFLLRRMAHPMTL